MTNEHLTLEDANRGLYVFNGSNSFDASYITASGNLLDGINIDSDSPFAALDNLGAFDNGATGISLTGPIGSLTNSTAYGNTGVGIAVSGTLTEASGDAAYDNGGWGFGFPSSGAPVIESTSSSG